MLQGCFVLWTYVVAAIPFGLVLTTLFGGEGDLRNQGSGNIGATNVARVFGWKFAAPVLMLDAAKGAVPVWLATQWWPSAGPLWLAVVAVSAFVGHCWSVYLEFRGGKGVATGAGSLLVLSPYSALLAIAAWAVVLISTGRSSVASLGAAIVLVLATAATDTRDLPVVLLLALGVAITHAANIRRLVRGEEKQVLKPVRWNRHPTPTPASLLCQGPAGTRSAPEVWGSSAPSVTPADKD
jgi:glycerol-3-phosphate acyltransferase PlsY